MRLPAQFEKKRSDFRELVALVREDYRAHGSDWTLPGFRAVAVYRFGVWTKTFGRPRLVHVLISAIYRFLHRYVRNHYTIELPATATVGRRLVIAHQGGIVIHHYARIGDDCLIHQNVTLGAATIETVDRGPALGNRVEIGCGAAIIGGVAIGNDVRIGPNAVVTMNVAEGSTVAAPAPRVFRLHRREPTSDVVGVAVGT